MRMARSNSGRAALKLLLILEHQGEIGQTADNAGVIVPQFLLINAQRPLEEPPSLRVLTGLLQEEGQVIQALRDERVIRAGDLLRLLQEFARHGNGGLKFSSRVQTSGLFG